VKGWLKSAVLGLFTAFCLVYAALMMAASKPFEYTIPLSTFVTVLACGTVLGLGLALLLHWRALRKGD